MVASSASSRRLQPLHEIGRAREQDAPAVLDERQADRGAEMVTLPLGHNPV